MKKLLFILLFLFCLGGVGEAQYIRENCGDIAPQFLISNGSTCKQTTNASSRAAGRNYYWSGTAWTEDNRPISGIDVGSTDSYVINPTPAIPSYEVGVPIYFKANTANTGAAALNVSGLGSITIKKVVGGVTTDLETNDIRANQWVQVVYDGTFFQMQSMLGNSPAGISGLTAGKIPKAASATSLTDSLGFSENGTNTLLLLPPILGDCGTNCLTLESLVTGTKTQQFPDIAGKFGITTGTLNTGSCAIFSSGAIIDGGKCGVAVRVRNDANQSINNTTETVLTFNTEDFDTDSMHSTVTNTSRITFVTAGVYIVGAAIDFDFNATGERYVCIKINNTTNINCESKQAVTSGSSTTRMNLVNAYNFAANDYIEVIVYQASGGALNSLTGSTYQSPIFWAVKVI